MWARFCLVISIAGTLTLISCGGGDLVIGGMLPATPTPVSTPTCLPSGSSCTLSTDCCSGACISPDGITLQCQ